MNRSNRKDIRPSLLDRLCDSDGARGSTSHYSVNELREAVQSDLQNLLNTRVRFLEPDPSLEDIQQSLVNFGLPDITTQSLVSEQGRRQFATWIEQTIRRFEPRFKNVRVKIGGGSEASAWQVRRQGLTFRVDAVLYADPAPEDVAFDSSVDPVNQTIRLKEVHR